jgi:hypothetical protein
VAKKNPSLFRVAQCVESDGPFELTTGRYYIVADEFCDLVDQEPYVVVVDDVNNHVTLRKARFNGNTFMNVAPGMFRDLNRSHYNENSSLSNLNPGLVLT